MTCKIKVVPNDQPNADGEWIEVDNQDAVKRWASGRLKSWAQSVEIFTPHVPQGMHIVSIRYA